MLKEWERVRQIPNEGFRRWFSDANFDLIVWYGDETQRSIEGFQLCYDKQGVERALTWHRSSGYLHNKIDDGELPVGPMKRTPILVRDGAFAKDDVREAFLTNARRVDPQIVSFVSQKIAEFSRANEE